MEYYSDITKNKIVPFAATWRALEGTVLTELSQAEKDKYCMVALVCGIWKNTTNQWKRQKEADAQTENKLVVTSRGGKMGVGKRKAQTIGCEVGYEDDLYNTGNVDIL